MRYFVSALVLSLVLLISCRGMYTSGFFVKTGRTYAPLSEKAYVKVFMTNQKVKGFEEVGTIEVIMSEKLTLTEAISGAKRTARKNGCNCIIFKSKVIQSKEEQSYLFRAGRLKR